jgi:hypothetical protein
MMKPRLKSLLIVSVLFVMLIGVMTFPLFLKLTTCMPGYFSTDESYAVLWNAWLTKYSFTHHIFMGKTEFINYPFGIDILNNRPSNYLWVWINAALALLSTPVLTYNIQLIANLFLTALCIFLLVRHLGSI